MRCRKASVTPYSPALFSMPCKLSKTSPVKRNAKPVEMHKCTRVDSIICHMTQVLTLETAQNNGRKRQCLQCSAAHTCCRRWSPGTSCSAKRSMLSGASKPKGPAVTAEAGCSSCVAESSCSTRDGKFCASAAAMLMQSPAYHHLNHRADVPRLIRDLILQAR